MPWADFEWLVTKWVFNRDISSLRSEELRDSFADSISYSTSKLSCAGLSGVSTSVTTSSPTVFGSKVLQWGHSFWPGTTALPDLHSDFASSRLISRRLPK